jgi:hypothetical protein
VKSLLDRDAGLSSADGQRCREYLRAVLSDDEGSRVMTIA